MLIVDDEPSVREFLARWLERWGYDVRQAGSATEALALMAISSAAVVLCDIRMPEHDGLWLTERIRARWPVTAVIMITGVDDMQTVMQCQRAGAVDYLAKPFGREMVFQALRRAEAALGAEGGRTVEHDTPGQVH